jgi:hypothetical protein
VGERDAADLERASSALRRSSLTASAVRVEAAINHGRIRRTRGAPILPLGGSDFGEGCELRAGGDRPYLTFVTLLLFMRGIHPKKFARSSGEQSHLLLRREFFYRFDEFAWVSFA